jgi:predicted enzyme related to lactoylglutathione lyase
MTDQVGRIHYIEMPSKGVEESAEFYRTVFGWTIRSRGDGVTAFDDAASAVSGAWITDLQPVGDPGFRIYISVVDAVATSREIEAAGGTIVREADPSAVDIVALFHDPSGNLLGIHQYNPDNA